MNDAHPVKQGMRIDASGMYRIGLQTVTHPGLWPQAWAGAGNLAQRGYGTPLLERRAAGSPAEGRRSSPVRSAHELADIQKILRRYVNDATTSRTIDIGDEKKCYCHDEW